MSDTVTVTLTARELTLLRVACLRRLTELNQKMDAVKRVEPSDAGAKVALDGLRKSYDETLTLLQGKLWDAVREAMDNNGSV